MSKLVCPQCGEDTHQLFEGYCEICCDENQMELDLFIAEQKAWDSLTENEKQEKIFQTKFLH